MVPARQQLSKHRSGKLRLSAASPPKTESRALAKGLFLLDHMAQARRSLSLAELAEAADLGKPSTLRILATLEVSGWLGRDNGRYRLDREWPSNHGEAWQRRLIAAALPEMRRLQAEFSETVTLAALLGDHVRVIEVLDSPQVIRMANYRGRIVPPYASSLGKAIAAFQPPERTAELLQIFGSYRFTEKTLTDGRAVEADLARVRKRGYACDDEETVAGGHCFGAPVRDSGGAVAAAISVSQPKQRLTARRGDSMPSVLMQSARRISSALGYRP